MWQGPRWECWFSVCPGSSDSGDGPTSKGTEPQHDFRPSEQTTEIPGTLLFCWGEKGGCPQTSIQVHTPQLSAFTLRHKNLGLLIEGLSSACWILLCRSIQSPSASDFYICQDQPFTNDQWQSYNKYYTAAKNRNSHTSFFCQKNKKLKNIFKDMPAKNFTFPFQLK